MVRTSHSKALQNKPQGLTEQQPTPPVSTSCVGFFVFFFWIPAPCQAAATGTRGPLGTRVPWCKKAQRRHPKPAPSPLFALFACTQSWGNATQPRCAELGWMSPCWVTALSPRCGDSRSGPARRQSSEHCARAAAGHGASPGAELDHFSSAARADSPRSCPGTTRGLALPSSSPHLHRVRSCASKAALVRAPQPQELVWEEGARREIPHPKCRIWLASVQPSATTQSLRAGPPWGHTSTTPEAHCGLCNGYHGDPVPRDARPASNHGPALSQSPSEFALTTLPHAFQATNPKGELISKPPATAQPPPSSHHLCPHQQCAQTPQK